MTLNAYLQSQKRQDCVLVLAGINNSYNLGGIIRTAAHYGVKGIYVRKCDKFGPAAAARVAEGGMEHIYALKVPMPIKQYKFENRWLSSDCSDGK